MTTKTKTTMAIVGAGKGLGAAVARRFGSEGFSVALISRTQEHVDALSAELGEEGITAKGYAADVADRESLSAALATAAEDLGTIEVVQYSPIPAKRFLKPFADTTVEDLEAATAFSVLGPATVVNQVLPGMKELGRGTVLLVNGGSAVNPRGAVTGTSVAFSAEAAYGQLLHDDVAGTGIHVGQLIIPLAIGGGDPHHAPDYLAERLWDIHSGRADFRTTITPVDE